MKLPVLKFVTIPLSLFSSDQLTPSEKMVLMAIELHSPDSSGASIGIQGIATTCGMSQKEVKQSLKSLHEKNALEVVMGENGERNLLAKIYKEDYYKSSHRPELEGTRPQDAETLDYDYIQEQWNTICKSQPKLSRFTPQRKRKIKSALKGADITVADLIKAFKIINSVQFFHTNERNWVATFDWCANAQSLTKILEGVYSKSYQEKRDYDNILNGGDINQQKDNDFYR